MVIISSIPRDVIIICSIVATDDAFAQTTLCNIGWLILKSLLLLRLTFGYLIIVDFETSE